ncbi:neutral alpha-glucosidase C-like isoform X1 [Diabrotica undecimpunctata]|uniref:neutral alpha-glucosidase C-like isoform X1 n=1 Tax=Diabrotica undecimpunctata TaxID=50387 RepID=UPI003B6395D0
MERSDKMLRLLLFLALIASYVSCANHTLYKDCARIPFCKKLRTIENPSKFTAQLDKLSQTGNIVSIPLTNSDSQELVLQISLLAHETARIKIAEKNSKRYQLADVLAEEPQTLEISAKTSEKEVTVSPKNASYSYKVVVTAGTPFNVEFYYDDNTKEVALNGEHLVFDKEDNAFAFATEFIDAKRLYGLHHHPIKLELPSTRDTDGKVLMDPYRNRNSDNDHYEVGSPMAVYGTVPVIYGHSEKQTSGIFLHNAAEQWVDIWYDEDTTSGWSYFMVESGTLDLFVLLGNQPKNVVRQFTKLTGVAHMPQLWTLGYHQCRWSYKTQEDTKSVVAQMDANNFPMDAIWLDIDYTDGKRYFTWDPETYSDPEELQRNLSSTNRKLVVILDPHIKVDEDYPVYTGAKGKYFVKSPNREDFKGDCWPGLSSYLDFLNPEARDYYASWYSYDKFKKSTPVLAGVWNDMNEPSVFDNELEKTLPFDVLHHGNVAHRDIHNIYGFLQTMATHQGLMERDNFTKRPFILTRSHFAGSQRYTAMWTGDNTADWPFLQVSYSECILSNIMGLVFCGADIGGFFNNPETELVQRWYQAGVWLPFYRGHAENTTDRREPYVYSAEVQDIIRNALRLRYRHIPVWYTLFYEHTRTGDPVVRPIFYDYPGSVDQDYHILLGSNILARPVMEKGARSVTVNFPGSEDGQWYRVDDGSFKIYSGQSSVILPVTISTSPYFYKAGSIITRRDEERSSTAEMQNDPFVLYVNVDKENKASGNLYVDDYTSFEYQNNQRYFYVNLAYQPNEIDISTIDGDFSGMTITFGQIIVHQQSDKDEKRYTRTVYTHLADGTPLKTMNIVEKLNGNKMVSLKL